MCINNIAADNMVRLSKVRIGLKLRGLLELSNSKTFLVRTIVLAPIVPSFSLECSASKMSFIRGWTCSSEELMRCLKTVSEANRMLSSTLVSRNSNPPEKRFSEMTPRALRLQ